jgi:hypothetical protein
MMERYRTQVPLPGGSGRLPSGAMQFEGDWPGLFLRGDDAIVLLGRIRYLAERLDKHEDPGVMSVILHLSRLADMIERDVVEGSEERPGGED